MFFAYLMSFMLGDFCVFTYLQKIAFMCLFAIQHSNWLTVMIL